LLPKYLASLIAPFLIPQTKPCNATAKHEHKARCRLLASGFWLLASGFWLLASGFWRCYWTSLSVCQQSTGGGNSQIEPVKANN
jgi:hypothetical protein